MLTQGLKAEMQRARTEHPSDFTSLSRNGPLFSLFPRDAAETGPMFDGTQGLLGGACLRSGHLHSRDVRPRHLFGGRALFHPINPVSSVSKDLHDPVVVVVGLDKHHPRLHLHL